MVSLHSTNVVAAEVRARLPKSVFEPARSRLLWLPLHFAVVICAGIGVALSASVWAKVGLSGLIGLSFAGLAFVAHETLHGAICRRRRLRKTVGFLGFLPFCLSPRLWVAWHNRVHHGNTNKLGIDPDAMATLCEYETGRLARWSTEAQQLGRGLFTLLIGFSVQSTSVLLSARKKGYLAQRHFRRAVLESLLGWLVWASVLLVVGPFDFVFVFLIPLLIGNAVVMAHILTNHSLRPADRHNDPLTSSTTVTLPRFLSFLTLDFGYHTEHHLFPAMSHRHGQRVSRILAELYPERYHRLPLLRALWLVCSRPRVFLDDHTVINPRTGRTESQLAGLSGAPSLAAQSPAAQSPAAQSPAAQSSSGSTGQKVPEVPSGRDPSEPSRINVSPPLSASSASNSPSVPPPAVSAS